MFFFRNNGENMKKRYLDVAYEDRDLAKRLGARWDPSVKRWYCTSGSPLAKIFTWRSQGTSRTTPPKAPVQTALAF